MMICGGDNKTEREDIRVSLNEFTEINPVEGGRQLAPGASLLHYRGNTRQMHELFVKISVVHSK